MRRQLDDLELCFLSAFTVFVQGSAGHGVAAARSARGQAKTSAGQAHLVPIGLHGGKVFTNAKKTSSMPPPDAS